MLPWLRDTLLRLLPHATRRGLRAIGHPGPDAPVLVTGNYALTVRRLERVLRGHDVWLLVANSRGINVWCAATGGHFTDHDVIGAIRATGLADRVRHHRLVLPQLAATGIEPRRIQAATGFESRWGPVSLDDLPAFLARGGKVHRGERTVRFPLRERLEMSVMWAVPIAAIGCVAVGLAVGARAGVVVGGVQLLAVVGLFAVEPWVPIVGLRGWLTYLVTAVMAVLVGVLLLWVTGGVALPAMEALVVACVAALALLSIDMAGTTPEHPGTMNSLGNRFEVELVEERCTGEAACVQVCPVEVLQMDGRRRKVVLAHPDACVRCGACIVQCPQDALRFRFADGRRVEAEAVRHTRVNMLGRRTIEVSREG